jgi:hypothetical protein
MNRTRINVFAFLLATLAPPAIASGDALGPDTVPDIEIVSAKIGGSGCPDVSARFTLSSDKRRLTVELDDYPAQPDRYASCNIAVLLSMPDDVQLALTDLDYRGYASISALPGRKARLRGEYFFAGDTGPVGTQIFPRGFTGNYDIWPGSLGTVWSSCGDEEVLARANTGIRIWGMDSRVTIRKIYLYLDWDYC